MLKKGSLISSEVVKMKIHEYDYMYCLPNQTKYHLVLDFFFTLTGFIFPKTLLN